jgi:hypothetical protein
MDHFDRRLCLSGMLLFFAGCVLGFIVPAYAPHPGMLAAHLNAVQTGIFLLVLALLWPKLQLAPRRSAWLAHHPGGGHPALRAHASPDPKTQRSNS